MCSKGLGVEDKGTANGAALKIHRQELLRLIEKKDPDLAIISVVEAEEPGAKTPLVPGAVNIPLGALLREAAMNDAWKETYRKKRIVTVCPFGFRASVAARELAGLGFDARALDGGSNVWAVPAAASFDFVVVYGLPVSDVDKLNMAMAMASASQKAGNNNTALVLMNDGVYLGVKDAAAGGLKGTEHYGAPFGTVDDLLKGFLEAGGMVFVCHSCVVARKLDYSAMHPWVNRGSAPDIVRWIKSAKGDMQFL